MVQQEKRGIKQCCSESDNQRSASEKRKRKLYSDFRDGTEILKHSDFQLKSSIIHSEKLLFFYKAKYISILSELPHYKFKSFFSIILFLRLKKQILDG
jgi:hypothetical protein